MRSTAIAFLACAGLVASFKDVSALEAPRSMPAPSLRGNDIRDAPGAVDDAWAATEPDGLPVMTPESLAAVYRQAAPGGGSLTHTAFATFIGTMPTAMLPGDVADHPHQLENAAQLADTDADGHVSEPEFIARITSVMSAASVAAHQLASSVTSFPLDRAAFVAIEHDLLRGANLSLTEDALFEMMDVNGDAVVSRAEFLLGTFEEVMPTLMVEVTAAQIAAMLDVMSATTTVTNSVLDCARLPCLKVLECADGESVQVAEGDCCESCVADGIPIDGADDSVNDENTGKDELDDGVDSSGDSSGDDVAITPTTNPADITTALDDVSVTTTADSADVTTSLECNRMACPMEVLACADGESMQVAEGECCESCVADGTPTTTSSATSASSSTSTPSTLSTTTPVDDVFVYMDLEHANVSGSSTKPASSGDTDLIVMTAAIAILLLLAGAIVVAVVVKKQRKAAENNTPVVRFSQAGYDNPVYESGVYDSAV